MENHEANAVTTSHPRTASSARQRRISQIIPFVRDGDGDYRAKFGGIKFQLHKSSDAGFLMAQSFKKAQADGEFLGSARFGAASKSRKEFS